MFCVDGHALVQDTTVFPEAGPRTTGLIFNAAGNKLTETLGLGSAAEATTTYTYDAKGRITSLLDPVGNTTTWVYDDVARTVVMTDELTNQTTTQYDLYFQSGPDAKVPARLHVYNAVLHARHEVAVRSLLVLVRAKADGPKTCR